MLYYLDSPPVFVRLRAILQKHSAGLSVTADGPTRYCMEGGSHPTHRTPMPTAWVEIGKACCGFHLMPVCGCPRLRDGMSKELKKRMQGKSCFNFKPIDERLFEELDRLTSDGLAAFRATGYLSQPGGR